MVALARRLQPAGAVGRHAPPGARQNEPLPGTSAHYDLCYRFQQPGDAIAHAIDGERETTISATDETLGKMVHLPLQWKPAEPLLVRAIGRTDLCGVVVETDPGNQPGVVVDTLAINGARFGTMLAWESAAWQIEVSRRSPDLVILELGNASGEPGVPLDVEGHSVSPR